MSSERFEPALSTYQHEFWDVESADDVERERPSWWSTRKKSVSFWVLVGVTAAVALAGGGAVMSTRLGGDALSTRSALKAAKATKTVKTVKTTKVMKGTKIAKAMKAAKPKNLKPKVNTEYAGPNCPDGQYMASKACHQCPAGSMCSGNKKTMCPVGQYQPKAGEAVCIPASCGSFVPGPGASMQLTCRAGTFSNAGAKSCTPTPAGTFTGAGACAPGKCPKGKYQDCAGQPDCQQPPCGHYVDTAGSINFKQCPAGTIQPLIGQTGCNQVGQGEYSGPGHCKARKCIPGFYQNLPGQPQCKPADCGKKVPNMGSNNQVSCPTGQYQPEPGQPVCIDIPAGYVSDQNGCAIKCCPPGKFRNSKFQCEDAPCGSYVPIKCASMVTKCPDGYFTSGPGASSCTIAPPGSIPNPNKCGKQPCGTGTYQDKPGQTSCKDTKCGHIAPNTGMSSQTPCPAGQYQDKTGQTSCIPCAAGTANPSTGQCSCPACVAGTFQKDAGQQTCVDSPCGHFVSGTGATKALPCPAGTYQPKTKQTGCIDAAPGEFTVGGKCAVEDCPPGRYTDKPKMTKCLNAPCGSFVAGPKSASPIKCSKGDYQPLTAQTKCLPAPTGSYTDTQGSCTETPCTPGYYQDQTGQQSCKPAQCGHYVVIHGASTQSPCGKGRFQPGTAKTKCNLAQPGSFVNTETACSETPCVKGEYTDCQGQSACIKAPCGYFVNAAGGKTVQKCAEGTYQDMPGQESCKTTPAGAFSKAGYCQAQQCDPGTYQSQPQKNMCVKASCGNFVDIEGAKSQSPCAAGTYQPSTGQVGCLPTTMVLAPNPGTCQKVGQYFSACSAMTKGIFGSGWQLVRRVGPSFGKWHPETDTLAGTQVYGTFQNSDTVDATFSKKFSNIPFTQFLFVTGDCSTWVLTSRQSVLGAIYSDSPRRACRTSDHPNGPISVKWYNRNHCCPEDPWVSVIDHHPAIAAGKIVYGEASFGSTHAATVIPVKNGANVFIRNANLDADGCAVP